MRFIVIFTLIIFSGLNLIAQPIQKQQTKVRVNVEDGSGFLIPDFNKLNNLPHENYAYLPESGLKLYQSPEGEPFAMLSRFCPVGKFTDGNLRMFILPDTNSNQCVHITIEDLIHYSDETYIIPYYEKSRGYVRILDAKKFGEIWVKIEDVLIRDFIVLSWKDYLVERRSIPVFAKEELILRESPYPDAREVAKVSGDAMEIWITGFDGGFCEGTYCKVKVKSYRVNPCLHRGNEKDNLIGEYEGWIPLIYGNGMPTVYINTKGC